MFLFSELQVECLKFGISKNSYCYFVYSMSAGTLFSITTIACFFHWVGLPSCFMLERVPGQYELSAVAGCSIQASCFFL